MVPVFDNFMNTLDRFAMIAKSIVGDSLTGSATFSFHSSNVPSRVDSVMLTRRGQQLVLRTTIARFVN